MVRRNTMRNTQELDSVVLFAIFISLKWHRHFLARTGSSGGRNSEEEERGGEKRSVSLLF